MTGLATPVVRITADEPGRLLALEAETAAVPEALSSFVRGLVRMTGVGDDDEWWRPKRLRIDRATGTLTIVEGHALRDEERTETIALSDVTGLTVRTRYAAPSGRDPAVPPSPDAPRHLQAVAHVRDGPGDPRDRPIPLQVLGVDTREKAADFAYRLGAALGLRHQRLVRGDPRRIEISMTREDAPGSESLPSIDGPADYWGDKVVAAAVAAAAALRIGAPDPARFPGKGRITRWSPGDEVRYHKAFEGLAIGCFPVALAGLLAAPAAWWLSGDAAATVVALVVGLLFGGMALVVIAKSLPLDLRILWPEQAIVVKGLFNARGIPFREVASLELQCVRTYQSGSRSQSAYNNYSCHLRAHVRAPGTLEARPVDLISTRSFKADAETPYDAALPLTKGLAEALGVEWRVTDYE